MDFDYTLKVSKTILRPKYQAVKILTIERVFAQSDVGSYTQRPDYVQKGFRIAELHERKNELREPMLPDLRVAEVVASFLLIITVLV